MADTSIGAGSIHYNGGEDGEDDEEGDLTPEDLDALRALQVQVEEEADADEILGQGIPQSPQPVREAALGQAPPEQPARARTHAAAASASTGATDPLSALADQIDWTSARQEAVRPEAPGLGAVGVRRRRGGGTGGAAADGVATGAQPTPLKPPEPAASPEPLVTPEVPKGRIAVEKPARASQPTPAIGDPQVEKPDPAKLRVTVAVSDLLQDTSANTLTLSLDQLQELGLSARARPRDTIRRVLQPWLADVTAEKCFPGWELIWEGEALLCTRLVPLPTQRAASDAQVLGSPAATPQKRSRRFSARGAAVGVAPTDIDAQGPQPRSVEPEPLLTPSPATAEASGSGGTVQTAVATGPMPGGVIGGGGNQSGAAADAVQDPDEDGYAGAPADQEALEDEFIARVEAAVVVRIEQLLGESRREMDQQLQQQRAAFQDAMTAATTTIAEQAKLLANRDEGSTGAARATRPTDPVPPEEDDSDWIAAAESSPLSGWEAIRQGDRVLPPLLLMATGIVIGIAMPIAAWMTAVLTPLAGCLVYLIGRRDETGQMSAGAALAAGLALLYAAERFRAGHLEATLDALARALGGS